MLARALRRAPRAARAPAAGSRACTPRLRPRPLPLAAGWSLVPRRLYCGSGRLAKNTWEEAGSEIDIAKTSRLFPQPRVTLNILVDKLQEKPFEVYYKQSAIAPKISKKNNAEKNDWTCSYVFQWPEQKKFESTALSKKQAAEKAASAAVHWLHTIGRLDDRGSPVHDRQRLQQLRENLNPPVVISTSVESQQSIQRVVEHYDGGIKEIFAKAHRAVLQKEHNNFLAVTNDSTIEDEDELTDDDLSSKVQQDLESSTELQRRVHPVYGRPIVAPTDTSLARRDDNLRRKFISYYEGLTPLPIDGYVDSFIQTLSSSRTVVLVGAAGCGKSTRAPVAVLREGGASATVLVSQPRRVAAVGLASRVASELGEQVGETVGYQVRLHAKLPRPPGGSILYCTSGVLLRRLQTNPGLEGCSHVFIDEAHERDINTDIILLLLRRALRLNSQLKVVVMSATLDTAVFTSYFDDCPILEVPGRTYPVESTYLEDIQQRLGNLRLQNFREASEKADVRPQINCKEVAEVIKAVDVKEPEGAMLVFLPGWAEIKAVRGFLAEFFDNSGRHFVLPVHSKLSTTEQVKMFSRPPPGVRKIILATNIAETSVTIPDVTCVVDSGVHKENRMKQGTGTSSLETVWISQAAAKQRMGRAGRVQPGRCYKLYTREKEEAFLTHTSPEVLRVPLEKTVLDCKCYAPNDKAEQFLAQLPEPPSSEAIQRAVDDLVDLGALSLPEQRLTALGRLISTFTLHPRLCVALLHSVVLCNVASTLNVVTQLAANVEVFADAVERREEIRSIKAKFHPTSDHLALHWIQEEYSSSEDAEKFCDQHGLRKERLKFVRDLSNLHLEQLHQCGILEPGPDYSQLNTYSDVDELTKAVLFSGADCSLMTKQCLKTKGRVHRQTGIFASTGERAHISSESVNYKIHKAGSGAALLAYFGGMHSVERRALVVHRTSLLSWLTAVLFSKGDYSVAAGTAEDGSERRLIHFPRHKLTVHTSPRQAELLLDLRRILWETFRYFTERDRTSEVDMEVYDEVIDFRNKLVKTVAKLLMEAENELIMSNREKMENRRG